MKNLKTVKDENGFKTSVEKFCQMSDKGFEVNLQGVQLSEVQYGRVEIAPVKVTELFGPLPVLEPSVVGSSLLTSLAVPIVPGSYRPAIHAD